MRGYFDGLLSFLGHSMDEQFVKRESGSMVLVSGSPDVLLDLLAGYEAPVTEKWIDRASA